MATLGFTATALTTRNYTLSAADVTRVLNALKATYGQVPSGPPVNGVQGMRDMTNQEVFDRWSSGTTQGLANLVRSVELQAAATTAAGAFVPVVIT